MTIFIITFLFILAIIILVVLQNTLSPLFVDKKVNKRLLRDGTQADAVLLNMQQTGIYVNNRPQVKLLMQVHPKTGHNYITEIKEVLSLMDLTQLHVGGKFKVKYNPSNVKEVVIVK